MENKCIQCEKVEVTMQNIKTHWCSMKCKGQFFYDCYYPSALADKLIQDHKNKRMKEGIKELGKIGGKQ